MSGDPRHGPIPVVVSKPGAEPIILRLRQMDGIYRVAFSCEAAEIYEAIERGDGEASAFGLQSLTLAPASAGGNARAARFHIELALALSWAWLDVEGVEDGGALWDGSRVSIVRLLRAGDEERDVPPLAAALGGWFTGPLLVTAAEGEGFGPSPIGAGAAGPTTAPGAVH